MTRALFSSASGLIGHNSQLAVVGNNLANVNTIGYKSQRLRFETIYDETLRGATAADGDFGGTNPKQIGHGVKVAAIDTILRQGTIIQSENSLDVALQGNGFFVVDDGVGNAFTRAGAFSVDANNILVDSATGFRVQQVGGGEITIPFGEIFPGQATDELTLAGNLNAATNSAQAQVLTSVQTLTSAGLAANAGTRLNDLDQTINPYVNGDRILISGTRANGSNVSAALTYIDYTSANEVQTLDVAGATGGAFNLTFNGATTADIPFNAAASDIRAALEALPTIGTGNVSVSGGPANTTPVVVTFVGALAKTNVAGIVAADGSTPLAGATAAGSVMTTAQGTNGGRSTVDDLLNAINDAFLSTTPGQGSTAGIDANGNLLLTADNTGPAALSLVLQSDPSDSSPGSGNTNFSGFQTTTAGQVGGLATTSVAVFDAQGGLHSVTLTFEKQAPNIWDLTSAVSAIDGTAVGFGRDNLVQGINFNEDGSLGAIGGTSANEVVATTSPFTTTQANAALGVLSTNSPLTVAGTAATGADLINNLDQTTAAYSAGDTILITGTDADGTQRNETFNLVTGNETVNDLLGKINTTFTGATATLTSAPTTLTGGNILLTANAAGPSLLTLGLMSNPDNTTGASTFDRFDSGATSARSLNDVDQNIVDYGIGDMIEITGTDFDGTAVNSIFTFGAGNDGTTIGELVAKIDSAFTGATATLDGNGAILLTANGTGQAELALTLADAATNTGKTSFSTTNEVVRGTDGDDDVTLELNNLAGAGVAQTLTLNLGTTNAFDGLTQAGGSNNVTASQDGFGPGFLVDVAVELDGAITGILDNGRTEALGQLAVATFINPAGLTRLPNTTFRDNVNSGPAAIATALVGGAGSILGGALESSNVDITVEFTRLITAQRGFQVNARAFVTTDEVLVETANLKR